MSALPSGSSTHADGAVSAEVVRHWRAHSFCEHSFPISPSQNETSRTGQGHAADMDEARNVTWSAGARSGEERGFEGSVISISSNDTSRRTGSSTIDVFSSGLSRRGMQENLVTPTEVYHHCSAF